MDFEYQTDDRCRCCGAPLVDAGRVGRLADGLIQAHGVDFVREALGITESGLRSLRNGTRRWSWVYLGKLLELQRVRKGRRVE